jgi:hypothetical protein
MTDSERDDQGHDEEPDRARREREFSRRALLRAGAMLPVGLTLGGLLAACGGGGHSDKSTTTSSSTTTSTPTGGAPQGGGGGGGTQGGGSPHGDHGDGGKHGDHADTPHGDTPHTDSPGKPRTIHDDSGSHSDFTGRATSTSPTYHFDSGPHADSTVNVPGDHEDTPHLDKAHADHS